MLQKIGVKFFPPFRQIGEDDQMVESYPSFFWVVAQFIHPLFFYRDEMPLELRMEMVGRCKVGLESFLRQSPAEFLPRSTEKAQTFLVIINEWIKALASHAVTADAGTLQRTLHGFSTTVQDELDRLPTFTVSKKGNLSIHSLVQGASQGYPQTVLELADEFIVNEINYSGKCLAFELPTSCGFHILRAVEIGIKGYLHAKTGVLPKLNQRNWGQYISLLEDAGADPDLIGVLKVLKTKRNPLMHPQDSLEVAEAVSLFCFCQAGIETLIANVRKDSLEIKFKASLKVLPTL